jgi:predicted acetyltransferase
MRRTQDESSHVALEAATPDQAGLLSNLLALYIHDLSSIFSIEVGGDGRFEYDELPLYWSEPDTRFPFLIRVGPHPAGFALVTRGSPVGDDPEHLDVAEFFVLRRHRRSHVGRRAAFLLWDRLPGRWIVRVSEANRAGLPFWRSTIEEYSRGGFSQSERAGAPHGWQVFTFSSAPISAP